MPCQTAATDTAANEQRLKDLRAYIQDTRARDHASSYLIAVLHHAQGLYGYLDRDVMQVVATEMGVPMSRIWGVATFYHYFNLTPRGTYVISVCRGTACYVKGGEKVLDAIKAHLHLETGETTPDMLFTLMETRCLGACGLAPTMMINNRIYGELTAARAIEIIERLRKQAK